MTLTLKNESAEDHNYTFDVDQRKVAYGTYTITPPLIKHSKLTRIEKGGIGKELSDGWALNYAIGCTHACRFCYVDSIHKRYGERRGGNLVKRAWGNYFLIPENIDAAIEKTPWERWNGIEVMISSTHDPYLPQLTRITKKILEKALAAGVKICIQTRSPLVRKHLKLLGEYRDQIRIQVSVATLNEQLFRIIEPRVASPTARVEILKYAKDYNLDTGIIIAPVFPPVHIRPDPFGDLEDIISAISEIRPDHIYGESLHIRGSNVSDLEAALNQAIKLNGFDMEAERNFYMILKTHNLEGIWWRER